MWNRVPPSGVAAIRASGLAIVVAALVAAVAGGFLYEPLQRPLALVLLPLAALAAWRGRREIRRSGWKGIVIGIAVVFALPLLAAQPSTFGPAFRGVW